MLPPNIIFVSYNNRDEKVMQEIIHFKI
jgi:hypothetical protein